MKLLENIGGLHYISTGENWYIFFWIQHKSNPNNFLKMTIKKYFWKKVRDFDTKQLAEKKLFYFKEIIYLKGGKILSACLHHS